MDEFNDYAIDMDSETLHQDFDDIDLNGENTVNNDSDNDSILMFE